MGRLADNKRVLHDYAILEKFEAGLVLTGAEVKSAKGGRINLHGSFVIPKMGELWLTGVNIAPYLPAKTTQPSYDPARDRKLLLKFGELSHLFGKIKEKGLTLVPLSVYTRHRLIKVEIGLARGKTKHDKRETLKKRELNREIRSSLRIKG